MCELVRVRARVARAERSSFQNIPVPLSGCHAKVSARNRKLQTHSSFQLSIATNEKVIMFASDTSPAIVYSPLNILFAVSVDSKKN